jgi:hypothetical protein
MSVNNVSLHFCNILDRRIDCGSADFQKWISTLSQLSVTGVEPEPETEPDPDLHGSSGHPNRLQKNGLKNVAALRLRIFKIGLPQFSESHIF